MPCVVATVPYTRDHRLFIKMYTVNSVIAHRVKAE